MDVDILLKSNLQSLIIKRMEWQKL
ncbi:hypothetical protein Goklo_029244 [Gossypium klotzschianum]|uniref:Uncharacterized protein n=1 Tax=Gossypium klotzschianum TaxID=34286 RepID=A0A7J8W5V8_9ROSI|nr:hypothetical protein [Gossypium klotzschianum]